MVLFIDVFVQLVHLKHSWLAKNYPGGLPLHSLIRGIVLIANPSIIDPRYRLKYRAKKSSAHHPAWSRQKTTHLIRRFTSLPFAYNSRGHKFIIIAWNQKYNWLPLVHRTTWIKDNDPIPWGRLSIVWQAAKAKPSDYVLPIHSRWGYIVCPQHYPTKVHLYLHLYKSSSKTNYTLSALNIPRPGLRFRSFSSN